MYEHPVQCSFGKIILCTGDQGMVRDDRMHMSL